MSASPSAVALPGPPGEAESPSRNDGVTMGCVDCGRMVAAVGRRRYCAAACRQVAWRRRQAVAVPPRSPVPARMPRPATVYECPSCGARLLGVQRCADCGVFCRRVGPGGACPHCDEPVAVADLLSGQALQ